MLFSDPRFLDAAAAEELDGWPHLQDVPIYTVGPATTRALSAISSSLNLFGADTGNGEALAHFILDHYSGWYESRERKPPLLFSVGEQRRDIIPRTLMDPALPEDRRIQVDELVVYGTGVMESFEQEFMQRLQETKTSIGRWAVVFSPTGCEAMLRSLGFLDPATGKAEMSKLQNRAGGDQERVYIATIGPTTRDYLRNQFSFEPDVCAEKPSPEGILAGIQKFLSHNKHL